MTSRQYLLSQAEHCRRSAEEAADAFIAEQLRRLAEEFERKARAVEHEQAATASA